MLHHTQTIFFMLLQDVTCLRSRHLADSTHRLRVGRLIVRGRVHPTTRTDRPPFLNLGDIQYAIVLICFRISKRNTQELHNVEQEFFFHRYVFKRTTPSKNERLGVRCKTDISLLVLFCRRGNRKAFVNLIFSSSVIYT